MYLVLHVGFSSCHEWGLLSRCGAQASHCGGFPRGTWALGLGPVVTAHRVSCPVAVESSRTGMEPMFPCTGRRILNPWTTREVPTLTNIANVELMVS